MKKQIYAVKGNFTSPAATVCLEAESAEQAVALARGKLEKLRKEICVNILDVVCVGELEK